MEIEVKRTDYIPALETTLGELKISDKFSCFTCEDQEREVKIQDKTAIPKGRYKVILSMSQRFKKELPELLNVPGFTGIRIHSGNSKVDTSGCLLLGYIKNSQLGKIGDSKRAVNDLIAILKTVNKDEEIFITIQ